ncbi:hypothetical protein [Flavobacterium sp. 3HN19-14]|uniref:hypothetical protein n=1 Tax=Flavobacterium sp. 3HN19-14 TaxID=3448133 RepID=UPI003EE3B6A3
MKKAVIVRHGTKYNIACDLDFLPEFMNYVMQDPQHTSEIKIIFSQILEGLKSKKFGDEPHGTKSMKPFKNRENDRIICSVKKAKGEKQTIIMSEIYLHKNSDEVDKKLDVRYKVVSKHEYEIIK